VMGGLPAKFDRAKRATESYVDDRIEQAEDVAISYAVAAALYAAAGVFAIAAVIVVANSFFRWIELRYGRFPAFGALGGLFFLLAIACVGLAIYRLKRPAIKFPGLASRLRVAVRTGPASEDLAPAAALASLRSKSDGRRKTSLRASLIIMAVTLAGWALGRRQNAGDLTSQQE
jgi:hypothetical protein